MLVSGSRIQVSIGDEVSLFISMVEVRTDVLLVPASKIVVGIEDEVLLLLSMGEVRSDVTLVSTSTIAVAGEDKFSYPHQQEKSDKLLHLSSHPQL